MQQLSEVEKAWLAGFIDGEGYIGITFQRKKETKQSAASPQYHPYLIVVNTNKEVIMFIKKIINDGNIYVLHEAASNSKESYQYKLTKRQPLLLCLESILPYLKVKQQQCRLLIDFIKRRADAKITTGRGSRGLTSFSSEDEEMYQRFLQLNKRGS